MTRPPPFTDVPTLLSWLDNLEPVDRVRIARLLGDTHTTGALARLADALVYDMTRAASRAEVADQLGITVRAVQRAVSNHIARTGEGGRRGPSRARVDATA